MNNIFNFKRFWITLRKDVLENGKKYLMMLLVFTGIATILFTLVSTGQCERESNSYHTLRNININLLAISVFAFYSLGLLAASLIMKPMNSKAKRISYLVIPASNFEKYLSRWLIVTVGFAVFFIVGIYVSDCLRVSIASSFYPKAGFPLIDFGKLIYTGEGEPYDYLFSDLTYSRQQIRFTILSFLFFHSLFMLGSSFRAKNSFPKTFITLAIIILLFISICCLTIWAFYPDFGSFGFVIETLSVNLREVGFTNERIFSCVFCIGYFIIFVNWALAFFRFRESEITERL